MKDIHATIVEIGFKIVIPLLFIMLIGGIFILFKNFLVGILTILSSSFLFAVSIIAYKLFRKDKEKYIRLHIWSIAWKGVGAILFFAFFFLFVTFTTFYSGDKDGAMIFGILSIILFSVSIILLLQNKRIRI